MCASSKLWLSCSHNLPPLADRNAQSGPCAMRMAQRSAVPPHRLTMLTSTPDATSHRTWGFRVEGLGFRV